MVNSLFGSDGQSVLGRTFHRGESVTPLVDCSATTQARHFSVTQEYVCKGSISIHISKFLNSVSPVV